MWYAGGFIMVKSLFKPVFSPLNINEIKADGWLLNQLHIQAAGLSGNLDKFWPDIKDSQWIGGSAEGWERVPYWLDGFIPLAWLLEDEDMKSRAAYYVNYIIEHQLRDGWICPGPDDNRGQYDVWALFLILKVLVVYYDAAKEERIEEVIRRALQALDKHIDYHTLYNWGQFRWFECLIPIFWLYERTEEEWLINLASKLQGQGFGWLEFFKNNWPYRKPDARKRWSFMSHVVNIAMMLKSGALIWRLSGKDEQLDCMEEIVELLDKYHGMVTGVFSGDECLSGNSPVQGTELCAVEEYMYSLEHLLAVSGRSHWGDRLEKIAYNALPAAFSPDMWSHQYDQQVNQVQCSKEEEAVFCTNGGEANLFGLEPNFGCCTANLSQAWPKLALSTVMKAEDGLAVCVYAPCNISTKVETVDVKIHLKTEYPFRDTMKFKVITNKEIKFALWLRIPEWASEAALTTESKEIKIQNKGFYRLETIWSGEKEFTLRFTMKPEIVERPNNLYAVTRGPLVYSLKLNERWKRINEDVPGREYPHCDYEVYSESPWNYGLCVDKDNPEKDIRFIEKPIEALPFSPEGAPVEAKIICRKVQWDMEMGAAAPYPSMDWISEEKEELVLIPYGCTNLRMTEMPLVK